MVEAVKDQNNRIIAYTNGEVGSTIGEATTIDVTLVPSYTVTFWNKEVNPEKQIGTEMVMEGGKLDKAPMRRWRQVQSCRDISLWHGRIRQERFIPTGL